MSRGTMRTPSRLSAGIPAPLRVLLVACAALLGMGSAADARASELSRSVLGAGGGLSAGGSSNVHGTVGQAFAGLSGTAALQGLYSGWWSDQALSLVPSFTIDVARRSVETSRLRIVFDGVCPERVDTLLFKDYSMTQNLRGDDVVGPSVEFYGATSVGFGSNPGFILPQALVSQGWSLTGYDSSRAEILVTSASSGQPAVQTTYTFYARQPYYAVDRRILFSQAPTSYGWQPFEAFIKPFSAATSQFRYRQVGPTHPVATKSFASCTTFCVNNWDNRWVQNIESSATVSILVPPSAPASQLTSVASVSAGATWVGPYLPAQLYNQDTSYRLIVHFSPTPLSPAGMDSLYSRVFADVVGVDPIREPADSTLSLTCQFARGSPFVLIRYAVSRRGPISLRIYDTGGRLVRDLVDGVENGGLHEAAWDGRDRAGMPANPGVYFVRLRTREGTAGAKGVLLR